MKLFQQLLVAPAALGLVAPFAANAADLNLSGVNQYATQDQVTSINQFSDVKPTDWAYQALSNLIDRYGCVAGYPDGTYRGHQAMTRYEAAALLNACLDRITEITDELKKLMKEFEKELAVVRGRVDGLEAKVGELEATQFSTTTKLQGQATFVIGAVNASGDSRGSGFNRNIQTTIIFLVLMLLFPSLSTRHAQKDSLRGQSSIKRTLIEPYVSIIDRLRTNIMHCMERQPLITTCVSTLLQASRARISSTPVFVQVTSVTPSTATE